MDPEIAKSLAPILTAFVTGLTAWLIARTNTGAQRQLATDAARREFKQRQIASALDLASKRVADYTALVMACQRGDVEQAREIYTRLATGQAVFLEGDFGVAERRDDVRGALDLYESEQKLMAQVRTCMERGDCECVGAAVNRASISP